MFIPEVSNLRAQPPAYWYAYSIRMSLVPEGCFLNGRHHSSCQLYWRHWIIRADDEVIDKVNGEAVIGKVMNQVDPSVLIRVGSELLSNRVCCNV